MNIVIIMPTMRWQNWPRVKANLQEARGFGREALGEKVNLTWMPVVYQDEFRAIEYVESGILFNTPWIHPLVIPAEPGCNAIARKLNAGLNEMAREWIPDRAYFFPGADDDFIPRSFARRFAEAAVGFEAKNGRAPKVIVCSCDRGQRCPPGAYGLGDLIAAPENMKVTKVTGSQAIIRMDALEGLRYAHHPWADGILLEQLHMKMPEEFCYIPDFFVPFNALQEGRWDADKLKTLIEK